MRFSRFYDLQDVRQSHLFSLEFLLFLTCLLLSKQHKVCSKKNSFVCYNIMVPSRLQHS